MTPKILIVEDDFSLQNLYDWILKKAGYEILGIANDGEQAIEMYRTLSEKPDIIIMDHRMPNKDGLETMKEILKNKVATKVIFASADLSVKNDALKLGAVAFLAKPFKADLLLQEIEKALV